MRGRDFNVEGRGYCVEGAGFESVEGEKILGDGERRIERERERERKREIKSDREEQI